MDLCENPDHDETQVTRRVTRGFMPSALVAARVAARKSVPDLARKSGVSEPTIRRWEGGRGAPQLDGLRKIIEVLAPEDLTVEGSSRIGDRLIDKFVDVPVDKRFPGDWRTLRVMTIGELAAAADVNVSMLGRIERGEVWPESPGVVARVAAELLISPEELRASYERARARD